MLNVMIPMAGAGSRFQVKGYTLPKPLIDINGTPMIIKVLNSLELPATQFLFVISKNSYTETLKKLITDNVKSCKFVELDYVTEGPACSGLLFENEINNDDELVIANCDQIMEWDSTNFLMNVRRFDGAVVTYHNDTDKNSYARIDKQGRVSEIREKEVISNVSLNGIHYWRCGKFFVESARMMIDEDDRAPNGEFYVGPTYNYMIKNNKTVGIYHIPNQQHHAVGVPLDLERYIKYEKT
jgi:NDP-sugar pyrophosphorylase family protein